MSGLEASAAVVGFIVGAIDITHKAVEIYRAVEDKSGIPRALRKVSEKLPSIEGILRNAEAQCKGVNFDSIDEQTLRDTKRDVQDCMVSCQELHELLLSAYPKEGSGRAGRLWNGTKTVFSSKGKTAEGLLDEIRMNLELLARRQIIINAGLLKDIKSLAEGSTQKPSALLSSDREAHDSLSAKNPDILQSWILRSHERTSTHVALSTKLQPVSAAHMLSVQLQQIQVAAPVLRAFTTGYPTMTPKSYTGVCQQRKQPTRTNGWPVAMTSNHGCIVVRIRILIYGYRAKARNNILHLEL